MIFFSSLILKLKSLLREWLKEGPAFAGALPESLPEAASSLCQRARAGDQNAIAMICEIRDNANRGIERAKEMHKEIEVYLKANPVASSMNCDIMAGEALTAFGAEEYEKVLLEKIVPLAQEDLKKAIVTVANGPSLLSGYKDLVSAFVETLPENEREAFMTGAVQTKIALQAMREMPHECQHALILGYVLGKARQIQAVRLPKTPMRLLSDAVGEELD